MRPRFANMLFLCFLLLLSAEAGAEPANDPARHDPADRAAALTAILTERLSLTADQQTRIREISERHAARVDVAVANYKRPELKKQIKTLNADRDKAFQEVLTQEQFATYQQDKRAILKAMKAQVRGEDDAG